ncbi:MAG: beta-ketoacyl-ACP synthase III [Oligosphaeraceae bacterium]
MSSLSFQHVRIAGVGAYLPERVVSNEELSATLDTSHQWIFSHTGIRQRRLAAPEEGASSMGVQAARRALEDAGVRPEELGMVITATSTADYASYPSTAALIQGKLGAANAGAFDLNAACTGFVYALAMGKYTCQNLGRPVLVVASEVNSRIVDWKDRATCVLFGDGAGAAVLAPSSSPGLLHEVLGAEGAGADSLVREAGLRTQEDSRRAPGYVRMDGRAVFQFAVRSMEKVIRRLLEETNHSLEEVAHFIPHQANGRILDAVARNMGLPPERFFRNIHEVANTSSASIPIALEELRRQGALKPGDLVLTVAFGAGLAYGGCLLRWQETP